MEPALLAFLLSLAAGLSTAVGALVPFFFGVQNSRMLGTALALSAGVMVFVSFVEILPSSGEAFRDHETDWVARYSMGLSHLCFFGGIGFAVLLSWLVHKIDPDHEHELELAAAPLATHSDSEDQTELHEFSTAFADPRRNVSFRRNPWLWIKEDWKGNGQRHRRSPRGQAARLRRTGILAALAVAIHNFPEGLATFVGTLADPTVGATLAVAIAIHNIPEGICVAVPIYIATGSRLRAFAWAFMSGLSEPVGALIGWMLVAMLGPFHLPLSLSSPLTHCAYSFSLVRRVPRCWGCSLAWWRG